MSAPQKKLRKKIEIYRYRYTEKGKHIWNKILTSKESR